MNQIKQTNNHDNKIRCSWPGNHPLALHYHDNEWGVPLHNDRKHFEFLLLDGFQAGLSWNTILNKRENFSNAFDEFDYTKIVHYNKSKIMELMNNSGIIRNKLKIEAAVTNAGAFIKVCEKFGSFDSYIWQFVDGKPINSKCDVNSHIPAKSPVSDKMSKELIKLGFKFTGSTICYAYMQATGMVNDHLVSCFRYNELIQLK